MSNASSDVTVMGRITGVYGIKGWVKVFSHTQPMENILNYKTWLVNRGGKWHEVKLREGKKHGKGIIAVFDDTTNREIAQQKYCGLDIAVPSSDLPELEEDDFYYHQLEGLRVITLDDKDLGVVKRVFSTGANDVLTIKGDSRAIDREERLVPYLYKRVVKEVDLEAGTIRVDWDSEF